MSIPVIYTGPWSKSALFNKAKLFAQQMEMYAPDDWQFGLWSTFVLELIGRAALADISPTLLADSANWRNISFSLEKKATAKRFTARSISSNDVFDRLAELEPSFTSEMNGFCKQHLDRRNTEMHSGEIVFDVTGNASWRPQFYIALKQLLVILREDLEEIIADGATAEAIIAAYEDSTAKSIEQDIKAYRQVWSKKSALEQAEAVDQAKAWATRHDGHRVQCPACNSPALVQGSPTGGVSTEINEQKGEIIQRQSLLPRSFECIACGLKILGLSKLAACGLGDAFTGKTMFSAAEFFDLYTEDDVEQAREEAIPDIEEDFNEY